MVSKLRSAAALLLLLFAVGGSLTGCANVHPDNTPRSPEFKM